MATYGLSSAISEFLLPLLVDLGVFEGNALAEFIEERGAFLPPDELILARTWLGTPLEALRDRRSEPGNHSSDCWSCDTRTGDQTVVTERLASQDLAQGDFLLARVVVAGTQHQIIGLPLEVTLRQRDSLISLLDSDPDAVDISVWLAAAFGAPQLANREGEKLVIGRATLRPTSTAWEELARQLDRRYGVAEDNQWTEAVDIDDDHVIRSFLRRQGDDLVVETNSVERFDRLLSTLREVASDLVVIDEQRQSPREALDQQADRMQSENSDQDPELPPELADAAAEMMRLKENSWLNEQIPALGGLTPRQAVADPTRREDLVALLNEFDSCVVPSPMLSFDVSRLRKELGL